MWRCVRLLVWEASERNIGVGNVVVPGDAVTLCLKFTLAFSMAYSNVQDWCRSTIIVIEYAVHGIHPEAMCLHHRPCNTNQQSFVTSHHMVNLNNSSLEKSPLEIS